MDYRVVNYDRFRAVQRRRPGGGRPRKYTDDTVSVSFRVPEKVRKQGRRKARTNRVNMTELLGYLYLDFVRRPIEEVRADLARLRAAHGPIELGP